MNTIGRIGLVLGVLAVIVSSVLAGEPAESVWRAGTAKAIITPKQPFWQAGFGSRTKPAEGKLHDLWIKALAVEDGQKQKAIVLTSDILGFPKALSDSVGGQVEKQYGIPRSRILLSSSHTHSGPVLTGSLVTVYPMDENQWALADQYTREFEQTIVKTIGEAIARLAPASFSVGMGECGFAVNRRNNKESEVPRMLADKQPFNGPNDHSVPVLAVRGEDGRLLAILFLYACHNSALNGYEYSGDYAGFAQIALEQRHPETLAMFAMGCGADQNAFPRRTVELCQKYGNQLADGVDAVLAKPMKALTPSLRAEYETIDIPFDGVVGMERLQADSAKNDYTGRWARATIQKIADLKAEGKELPKSYPAYPVQVWRWGADQIWIVLGGEVVVDYALSLKAKHGADVWVFGYANNVMSYIPSARVWKEGGYESGAFNVYGIGAERWCPDIETRIGDTVDQLVSRVRGNH